MKVENTPTDRLTQKQTGNANAVDKAQRTPDGEARLNSLGGKDRASLSERAILLAKARAKLDETPDVRAERVDTLREQILAGNYEVPVEELAKQFVTRFKAD